MPIFYILLFVWPFLAPGIWSLVIGQVILTLIVSSDDWTYTYRRESPPFFGWFFGGLVPYGITVLVLAGIYPEISKPHIEEKTELAETIPLISLAPQASVYGQFALGYGTVDSTAIYMSKRQNTDGGYENFIIKNKTTVYEDAPDKEHAALETFVVSTRETYKKVPAWARYIIKQSAVEKWRSSATYNKIHVPSGTIMRDFKA
jgi:hypothetical protein